MLDQRLAGIAAGALVVFAWLAFLFFKLDRHPDQREPSDDATDVDQYLRRTDLLDDHRDPQNPLEWIIVSSTDTKIHMVILLFVGTITITLALFGYRSEAGLGVYFTLVTLLVIVWFYGWDRLEERFEPTPPTESHTGQLNANSMLPDQVRYRLEQHQAFGRGDKPRQLGLTDLKISGILIIILGVLVALVVVLFNLISDQLLTLFNSI